MIIRTVTQLTQRVTIYIFIVFKSRLAIFSVDFESYFQYFKTVGWVIDSYLQKSSAAGTASVQASADDQPVHRDRWSPHETALWSSQWSTHAHDIYWYTSTYINTYIVAYHLVMSVTHRHNMIQQAQHSDTDKQPSISLVCLAEPNTQLQVDHLSGKPNPEMSGNLTAVREMLDFNKSQGSLGKNLVREKLPKTVYCKLHICIHTGI